MKKQWELTIQVEVKCSENFKRRNLTLSQDLNEKEHILTDETDFNINCQVK